MDKLPDIWREPLSEAYVLSAVLGDNDLVDQVRQIIPAADYFTPGLHREVYARVLALREKGQYVDFESVASGLAAHTFGDLTGIVTANFGVEDFFPSTIIAERVATHAELIRDAYHRTLIADGVKTGKIDQVRDYVLSMQKQGLARHLDLDQLIEQAYADLDLPDQETIDYPYPLFKAILGTIEPGQFIVVAARPSTGKSVMLQDFAMSALRSGKRVLFVSAEMTDRMLQKRLLCSMLDADLSLEQKRLSDGDYKALYARGLGELSELPGKMDVIFSNNVSELDGKLKGDHAYDLVVVDYLQFMQPLRPYRGDYERVTNTSSELVTMARKYAVPFVVAAQVNRDADGEQPKMSDLKGSGQIEQDADLIVALWRDEEDPTINGNRKVRVDVLKNRNGVVFRNSKAKIYSLNLVEGKYKFRSGNSLLT